MARPGFLDVDGQAVAVWWHAPDASPSEAGASGWGVVMCPAWGREEISSHGPWRAWAQALADAGHVAVRIDYPGEGDSAGTPEAASRLDLWSRAVEAAVQALLAQGVDRICLMGLRWGAVVAWQAALRCAGPWPQVQAVLAVAPVVRGRTHVRELGALQAASSGDDEAFARQGGFQSGGFVLSADELARWSGIDLAAMDTPPAGIRHVGMLDREDLPSADKWAQRLQAQGLSVQVQRLAGYGDMMLDPHHASLPQVWVEAGLAWLKGWASQTASTRSDGSPRIPANPSQQARIQATMDWAPLEFPARQTGGAQPSRGVSVPLDESFVTLPGTPAVGVWTVAAGGVPASGHAILLLNAGSTHHIGPSRLWVELARTWAAQGHHVLRLDLAGLGDAEPRPGAVVNQTYPFEAIEDVRAAAAWLRQQPGVKQVMAGGLCAGGYHALVAVRAGVRLDTIVMINPLVYLDAEGMDLSQQAGVGAHQAQSAMASYRQALLNPAKWRKLVSGQANLTVLAQVLQRRGKAVVSRLVRETTRRLGMPLKGDLARVMRDAMDAGTRIEFFFAADDPGLPLLREELGSMHARLSQRPQWHCTVLSAGDHVFTRWSDRMALLQALLARLPQP